MKADIKVECQNENQIKNRKEIDISPRRRRPSLEVSLCIAYIHFRSRDTFVPPSTRSFCPPSARETKRS